MRRIIGVGLIALAGCSTAPLAGLMDCVVPSRATTDPAPPSRDRNPLKDGPDWNSIPPPPDLQSRGGVEPLPPPIGLNDPLAPVATTSRRE